MSKKEFNELMKIKGEAWGMGMKQFVGYIVAEHGEEGLKKLEDTMAELGYPVKYREIGMADYYPLKLLAVSLPVIKRLFNYDDKKLQEFGKSQIKFPLIIRLIVRYFLSVERFSKEFPRLWRKGFTVGDIEIAELDKEKKYMIVRLKNFRIHPTHCPIFKGNLSMIVQIMVGSETTCEETKCLHRGDEYHEFLVKW
ncbi:MAG: hypothetical protein ACE5WD_14500 [Candidatus Aminicenantia bacterium]